MGAPPLQIVASGAPPFVQVSSGAPPFTVVTGNAPPITLVTDGAPPITLLNEDGSIWAPGPPAAPVNTVAPSISGGSTPPQVGETLFANRGTWTGQPVPTYTYQWKRGGVAISGATGLLYTLVTADLAAMITVTVTATNTQGNASATSAAVGPIAAAVTPPVNSVAPVASGSVPVGSVVSVTTGTWSGNPTPTYAYRWKRDGTAIGGATANTYTLVTADLGTMISCDVTATNTQGSATATSNSLGPVTSVSAVGGAALLTGETAGLGVDFTYAVDANRVAVKQ